MQRAPGRAALLCQHRLGLPRHRPLSVATQDGRTTGLPADDELIIRVEPSEQGGYVFGDRWLELSPRPTAAILANEQMAIGLYKRLTEAGLGAGRDLAIIGIIEEPSVRFLRPQVTRYGSDLQGLGMRLGEALLREMRTPAEPPVQERWPMQLTLGDSDSFRP